MTITVDGLHHTDAPPLDNPWVAAAWIAVHHPWAEELMRRVHATDVEGNYPDDESTELTYAETGLVDVDKLAATLEQARTHAAAWAQYEDRNPAPSDDVAYERWRLAGPQPSDSVREFAVMSSGEKRTLRVLAMLSDTGSHVTADSFETGDERAAPIVAAVLDVFAARVAQLRQHARDSEAAFERMLANGRNGQQ